MANFAKRLRNLCIPYLEKRESERKLARTRARDSGTLRRALPGWQIFLIAVGGVIGVTIFSTHGEILRLAGPGGLLVATVFVSVTMICVMECIGELVILWPVSNAMIEYVRYFVDKDLATVVGIAYWYSMSCVFATLTTLAAQFASYTIGSASGRGLLFYVVIPACLLLINVLGVEYYGLVEGIGGIVKLLLVAVGIIFMIVKAPEAKSGNLDTGFRYRKDVANSSVEAICIAIPLVAYGYIGTEIVSVTAFEAFERKSLRFPARFVSYIIASLYFVSALLQCFLVNWDDPCLQSLDEKGDTNKCIELRDPGSLLPPDWKAIIVIAAHQYSSQAMGRFFNGCITYFCISAANTALYVASRTLFGLTRGISQDTSNPILKPLRYFGFITPTRQVPLFALVFSAVAFYWQIILQLLDKLETTSLLKIMGTTSSIAAIIVWASQCLAFIRYYNWFRKFRDLNQQGQMILPPKYNRWDPQPEIPDCEWHKHRMLLSDFKLVPAVVGLTGCFFIVFVFSTASWWNGHVTNTEIFTAYAGPIVLTVIFLCLKVRKWNQRWWEPLNVDANELRFVITNLERNSNLPSDRENLAEAIEDVHVQRGGTELAAPKTPSVEVAVQV